MTLEEQIRQLRRPKKIAVCSAWGSPFIWTHNAYNCMNWVRPEGVDVKFLPGMGGWCPARRHMIGVELALEWGADHIMFFGADQICDTDILVKFCEHIERGWPAVTALVPVRGWVDRLQKPFQTLAWKWKKQHGENIVNPDFNLEYLEEINPEDAPYQEIVSVGSGALIFDVNLLLSLKKPWFSEKIVDDDWNRAPVMDTWFAYRLVTEAGGTILCDCTIAVQHLDIFPIDPSYGDRFSDYPRISAKEKSKALFSYLQQPGDGAE